MNTSFTQTPLVCFAKLHYFAVIVSFSHILPYYCTLQTNTFHTCFITMSFFQLLLHNNLSSVHSLTLPTYLTVFLDTFFTCMPSLLFYLTFPKWHLMCISDGPSASFLCYHLTHIQYSLCFLPCTPPY